MPLSPLQCLLREKRKMKMDIKIFFFAFALLPVCSGCALLLPEGEPPEGHIVENELPEKMSREQLVLSLSGRIAASSMQEFAGAPVSIEADDSAAPLAREALREAGKICGVRHGIAAAAVLSGKKVREGLYEFELWHFNRSLWRCSYELKKR